MYYEGSWLASRLGRQRAVLVPLARQHCRYGSTPFIEADTNITPRNLLTHHCAVTEQEVGKVDADENGRAER